MKLAKKLGVLIMVLLLSMALLTACGNNNDADDQVANTDQIQQEEQQQEEQGAERTTFNIAALKGPTAMGMVKMMDDSDKGVSKHEYNTTIYGAADEIVPLLVQGKVDVAALPCNLAAVLNVKTEGAIELAAVNTLGVLYMLDTDECIQSVADLKGKTIYTTGKGSVPEYTLNYILEKNGIDPSKDVTIEYKTESTEVASMLASDQDIIAMLPQPYVTTVQVKNDKVRIALDMTEEWEKVSPAEGTMLTGVIVARKAFVEENKAAFDEFLAEYKASTEFAVSNVDETAALVGQYDIVPEQIAKLALPYCNIQYIDGADMKAQVSAYLQVLFDQNPQAVGGQLPDEDFYYAK